jgi:hypothetical protein
MTVVHELDTTLFDSYVKPKSAAVTEIIKTGVLGGDVDWYDTPPPKGAFTAFSPGLQANGIHLDVS